MAVMLVITGGPVFAQAGADAASVTNEELEQFASAVEQVQTLQQEMASDSQARVADSDMGEARFQELFQAQQSGSEPENPATDAESQEFDEIIAELQQIQQQSNQRMVEAVQDEGLDVQRFNEIARAVQQDQNLMQRLREISAEG